MQINLRRDIMNGNGFVKGMALGVTAGAAMAVVMMPKKKKFTKKMTGKALKAVGELMDSVTSGLKI